MRKVLAQNALFGLVPKVNVLLIVAAVFLGGMLVVTLSRPYALDGAGKRSIEVQESSSSPGAAADERFILDDQLFSRKMLFGDAVRKKQETPKKEFALLGISTGSKLLAMIRDTRENKDYYCKVGDAIGDFIVKDIRKDKVILQSPEGLMEIMR